MGLTAMYRPVRSLLRLSRFSPLAIAMLSLGLTGCLSSSGSSSDDGPAPDAGAGPIESGPEMPDLDPARVLPIIFVHGVAGSASQYQTQALRYASNGYPDEMIHAYEYSTDGEALVRAAAAGSQSAPLDSFVDNVLTEHEAEQVYLVCHSLGTFVCSGYLGDADRAAKVAGFIGVDGTVAADCPGGVPCKGIFVSRARALGADNLYLEDEAHVQVATSEASFAGQFEFFTGVAPARTQILAEEGTVAVSGRAVNFPANSGAEGTTLNVWSIDEETGVRTQEEPLATAAIDATGVWGPFELEVGARYEFELLRPSRSPQHFYRQPFLRESRLVRLNTSPAGSDIETNTHTSPDHSALVISRDKEFWGNRGEQNDVLEISTTSALWGEEPAFNVMTNVDAPDVIGIHVHDAESRPAVTSGELLPYFPDRPFQTGVDVNMPATTPPDGTITVVSTPRGSTERQQVFNVPNWASHEHRITLSFNDFEQE